MTEDEKQRLVIEIGARIKVWIKKENKRIKHIARRVGLTHDYFAKVLQGEYGQSLRIEAIHEIADAIVEDEQNQQERRVKKLCLLIDLCGINKHELIQFLLTPEDFALLMKHLKE